MIQHIGLRNGGAKLNVILMVLTIFQFYLNNAIPFEPGYFYAMQN